MTKQQRITKAYKKAYDKERKVIYPPGGTLQFVKERPGQDDEVLLTVLTGWLPTVERTRGSVQTLRKYSVVDFADTALDQDDQPARMTQAVAEGTNRIVDTGGDVTFEVDTFDAPYEAPLQWTFFCTEQVVGAIQ